MCKITAFVKGNRAEQWTKPYRLLNVIFLYSHAHAAGNTGYNVRVRRGEWVIVRL